MAKIKINSECPLYDGMPVTFQAPCDCTAVDGLTVVYETTSQNFSFRDAHGNDLAGIGNLFAAGAYVKVILNTVSGYAYIQNADTNKYIETQLANKAPAGYGLGGGGRMCSDCNDAVDNGWYSCAVTANAPSETNYGWMIVSSRNGAGGMIRQDYYTALGTPTHYYRYAASGVWSDWVSDDITYGTTDLTAGSSALPSGRLYFVYE